MADDKEKKRPIPTPRNVTVVRSPEHCESDDSQTDGRVPEAVFTTESTHQRPSYGEPVESMREADYVNITWIGSPGARGSPSQPLPLSRRASTQERKAKPVPARRSKSTETPLTLDSRKVATLPRPMPRRNLTERHDQPTTSRETTYPINGQLIAETSQSRCPALELSKTLESKPDLASRDHIQSRVQGQETKQDIASGGHVQPPVQRLKTKPDVSPRYHVQYHDNDEIVNTSKSDQGDFVGKDENLTESVERKLNPPATYGTGVTEEPMTFSRELHCIVCNETYLVILYCRDCEKQFCLKCDEIHHSRAAIAIHRRFAKYYDREEYEHNTLLEVSSKKHNRGNIVECTIEQVEKTRWDENYKKKVIRRMLMDHRKMSSVATDIFMSLRYEDNREISHCLIAIESVERETLEKARGFIKMCAVCCTDTVVSQLIGIPNCQCHVCAGCFSVHFATLAKETTCMYKFVCPACDQPDLKSCSEEEFSDYFSLLATLLQQNLGKSEYELFHTKLLTWGLMKDENFRWCANPQCGSGFINERSDKKIRCENCKHYQCSVCNKPQIRKRQSSSYYTAYTGIHCFDNTCGGIQDRLRDGLEWSEQHDDVTCEEYDNWTKMNHPDFQAVGLAIYLSKNGIDCPKCKMRYELAKGGCMHFTCSICKYEFCCGCDLPFQRYPLCGGSEICAGKGLHAHHPRDCLYHLRDQSSDKLQKLLQHGRVTYATEAVTDGAIPQSSGCPVMIQMERVTGFTDVNCGNSLKDQTGLCENHYKEYLVSLINQNGIDPVDIFTKDELIADLKRNEFYVPEKLISESEIMYCSRLKQVVRGQIPIRFSRMRETANIQ